MDEVLEAVGEGLGSTAILPLIVGLLRDSEAEVRVAIVKKLVPIAKFIGKDRVAEHIVPTIKAFGTDPIDAVRGGKTKPVLQMMMKA